MTIVSATEAYFDKVAAASSFAPDLNSEESDDDSTVDDDGDIVAFPKVNLEISQCSLLYDLNPCVLLYDTFECDTEFLLLSNDVSLHACRQSKSADIVPVDKSFDQRVGIFSGFILCYLLEKSQIDMPIGMWARCRQFLSLVQLICHAISEGMKVYEFFKACLPNGDMSANQGATLLKEMITINSFEEYPVFIENVDAELLLELQVAQICATRRRKIALYTVDSKTLVLMMDPHFVAFINMMNNRFHGHDGGSLIIRAIECKKSFVQTVAQLMGIEHTSCGSLWIMKC